MRTGLVVSLLSLCLTTLGCGDSSSGVDRDKYLDELSADEVSKVCEWMIDKEGGPGEYPCTEILKIRVHSQEECESDPRPHCKVSALEDCMIELEGDVCRLLSKDPPQSCKDYFGCALNGG